MAKTKEELETLKKEYEKLATNLSELSEEELKLVIGGDGAHKEKLCEFPFNVAGAPDMSSKFAFARDPLQGSLATFGPSKMAAVIATIMDEKKYK